MSDDTFKAPSTFESVLLAELNLGLPPLFFYELIREPNDWSYVLKLHVMFESALNKVLEKRGPEDDYDQPSTYYSKVEKALQSGAVVEDEHYRNFLVSLNYLRNCFAHRASYIVAAISSVINEMPAHRRDIVVQSLAVGWGIPGGNQASPENRPYRRKLMSEHPRFVIHFSAGFALEMLSLAYYFRLGKDGKFYGDEFRPQLQDLLNDPVVIETGRKIRSLMSDGEQSQDE